MFEYRTILDRPTFFDPFGWDDLFRGFDRLAREFDRGSSETRASTTPSVVEEGDKFVLRVDAPGVSEKDVHVDLHDGILTITAERQVDTPEGYSARRRERAPFRLSRSYAVGDTVDPEKTTAGLKDGVLTVTLAKAPAAQKKTITVTSA